MDRRNTTNVFVGFSLIAKGNDLNGYIFSDENHARQWLAQDYIKDARYGIRLIHYKKRRCCGAPHCLKVIKQMPAEKFLKTKRWTDKAGRIINLPE